MASDIIPWGDKARGLLTFWVKAYNATWNSDDVLIRAGGYVGGALVLSFAVECAIKALLEAKGKPITKKLWTHNLYKLFRELPPETRVKASNIYQSIIKKENDIRAHAASVNNLIACLKTHDDSFMEWRYRIKMTTKFSPVLMSYACISLLTIIYPEVRFSVSSSTSSEMEVVGGKVV